MKNKNFFKVIPFELFSKHNILGICACAVFSIFGLAIYNGDTTLVPSSVCTLLLLLNLLLVVVSLMSYKNGIHVRHPRLLFALLLYWFVNIIYVADGVNIGLGIPTLVFSIYICCIPKDQFLIALRIYTFLFFCMCLGGIIAYVSFVLGLPLPHRIVDYYSVVHLDFYIDYKFSYILMHGQAQGLRLCGLFNEPGYLGTFAAFILILNKFKLNFQNIVIFLAACLSFSMAFFSLIITYWGFRMLSAGKKAPIIIAFAYFAFNIIVPNIHFDNPEFEYLVNRFTVTDGNFEGDNRNNDAGEREYNAVMSNPSTMLFGKGAYYHNTTDATIVSHKRWIVQYGVVGFLLFYGMFCLYGIKLSRKLNGRYCISSIQYLIIFLISTYQRPYLYDINYVFLLFGGIMQLTESENMLLLDNHTNNN